MWGGNSETDFLSVRDVDSEEAPSTRIALKIVLRRRGGMLLVLLALSGCAELAEVLIDTASVGFCSGCDWIIQEWDDPGWSTHNSDPYDTEALCEQELVKQSIENPDRGHRCIYEGDLSHGETTVVNSGGFCYGCDWVVEIDEYRSWERTEATTYHTEGVCQQALWHQTKENPNRNFRCINMDW